MNIKPLLDLTCLTVANMIKGKSPEEIRQHFNIVNDFTPEEVCREAAGRETACPTNDPFPDMSSRHCWSAGGGSPTGEPVGL